MTRTKPQRLNPPWTIEEEPGGNWLFIHPSGKFRLTPRTDGTASFVGIGKTGGMTDIHTIGQVFMASPCEALRQVLAYLDGWRMAWGREHDRRPLWREKR